MVEADRRVTINRAPVLTLLLRRLTESGFFYFDHHPSHAPSVDL
jgi:hypothetical protein